jgi:hypothetical protein
MAEKSLVNDEAEMDGVEPPDELELVVVVFDFFELPQAATTSAAATATATRAARLLSRCMDFLLRR